MLKRPLHAARLIIPILTMTLIASGCGISNSDRASSEPDQISKKAIESSIKTLDSNSSRFTTETKFKGIEGMPIEVGMSAEGAFDYKTNSGSMTSTLPKIGNLHIASAKTVTANEAIYVQLPEPVALVTGGRNWVKADVGSWLRAVGLNSQNVANAITVDPQHMLSLIRSSTGGGKQIGPETIRGVETTHYELGLDFKGISKQIGLPESQQQFFTSFAELVEGQVIPAEIWIDKEGKVRKFKYSLNLALLALAVPGAAPMVGTISTTLELYDFGVKVDAPIPDKTKTIDLNGLLKLNPIDPLVSMIQPGLDLLK